MSLIEFENISKIFTNNSTNPREILTDINFSIKIGECFTIIGPNGSGKTTLLRILGLLEKPSSGKIIFSGKDMTNLSKKEIYNFRKKFSFVRQKPVVLNTTVANNIAYGLKIRGMDKNEVISKVSDILNIVGLRHLANKNARTLSGGEIQRVVIAMNFVISPEVYILDELSANLDPKNSQLLENIINKIKQDKKNTIIMSTHDPKEAIKLADRICVLNDGKVSQVGTPNEVFTTPKDEFTALFMGYENIFKGDAHIDKESGLNLININGLKITTTSKKEGNVKVCIRPESIVISKETASNNSFRNNFRGDIEEIRDLGNITHIIIRCSSVKFLASITKLSCKNLELKRNTVVNISFKATDVACL